MGRFREKTKNGLRELRRDPVLVTSMAAALISAFFVPPSGAYLGYLDLRVLCLLLSLMLTVAGLKQAGVFDLLTARLLKMAGNTRRLAAILIGVCFFSSMLITNDVALITFVPLAVMTLTQVGRRKLLIPVIVLQTVAANMGSMLTPLGNPQNLYLYEISGMTAGAFLRVMAIPTGIAMFLLMGAVFWIKLETIELSKASETGRVKPRTILLWAVLFVLCLLTVIHVLPYGLVLAVTVCAAAITDRAILRQADYGLLLTFSFFFIFIGNVKNIPAVSEALSALVCGRELLVGILLSQVVSNVPAAMLLSGFTNNYSALLLGVNLGGLGTLIASMASLISYKLYAETAGARVGKYVVVFTGVSLLFLGILWGVAALLKF